MLLLPTSLVVPPRQATSLVVPPRQATSLVVLIADTLMARGASPELPVVIVESATLPGERHIAVHLADLGAAAAQMITGPAVILLGEVYAKVQSSEAAAEPLARSRIA